MSLANVQEIDAFVRDELVPGIESQIVQNNAILARLEGKDRYLADGGEHIRVAARYERLPGGAYPRGEKFSTEQKKTVKEYVLPWVIMGSSKISTNQWGKSEMITLSKQAYSCAAAETKCGNLIWGSDSPNCRKMNLQRQTEMFCPSIFCRR